MASNTLHPSTNPTAIYDAAAIRNESIPLYAICIRGAITDVDVSTIPCDSAIIDINSGTVIVKIADNDNGVTAWSDLVANGALGKKLASTVAAASTALTDGSIFIGSVANLAAIKALSGDMTMTREGVVSIGAVKVLESMINTGAVTEAKIGTGAVTNIKIGALAVTRAKMSAAAALIDKTIALPDIPASATPTVIAYIQMAVAGTLSAAKVISLATQTANDTNYFTFAVTNLTGAVAMLAVSDANTTKATGGTTLTADTSRILTLHGTPANLDVAAGDWIKVAFTVTGTPTASAAAAFNLQFTAVA